MNKKFIITTAVILSLVVGGVATFKIYADVTLKERIAQVAGESLATMLASQISGEVVQNTKLGGASAGPDRFSPDGCESVNGFKTCHAYARESFATTSVVCSVRSPNATSTIANYGYNGFGATTTATVLTIATSSSAFATTTALDSQAIVAGAQFSYSPSTSTTPAVKLRDWRVLPPNTYMTFGLQDATPDGTPGTFTHARGCFLQTIVF